MCELDRFVLAQDKCFNNAVEELKSGKKRSHWMWYVFPQCEGLGSSSTAIKYSIKSKQEALSYLNHEVLYNRLIICCDILLELDNNISHILSFPDDKKLQSCLTLFMNVNPEIGIFKQLLIKYFNGEECLATNRFLKFAQAN